MRWAEAGAITQDPIGIGYKSVEAAVMAILGEEVPETIDTGFHWFDATNIDDDDAVYCAFSDLNHFSGNLVSCAQFHFVASSLHRL